MIQSTLPDGSACWAITEAWDWAMPPEMKATLPSAIESSLSNRETRRRLGSTLRLSWKFRVLLQGATARIFVQNLRQIRSSLVVVPLWVYARTWGIDVPFYFSSVYGGVNALMDFDGHLAFAGIPDVQFYLAGSEPSGQPSSLTWTPAMVGYISPESSYEWINDDILAWTVEFTESSRFEYEIGRAHV